MNKVVSACIPIEVLTEMDLRLKSGGYSSRSDFIRDAIREKLFRDYIEDPKPKETKQ